MSIAIGPDGFATIAYANGTNLRVAKCNNLACTAPLLTTVDTGATIRYTAVATGSDGLPVIAYEYGNALRVVHCSKSTKVLVDRTPSTTEGPFASIAIGPDGQPVMTYLDSTNGKVRDAKPGYTSWVANSWTH